jgi:predicted transcriptional regulator YdeE
VQIHHPKTLHIAGIQIRTSNQAERSGHGKIPKLWERFYREVSGHLLPKGTPYGVYTDFESDAEEEYSLTVGVEVPEDFCPSQELVVVKTQPGSYLKFVAEGDIPQMVYQVWSDVWTYFSERDAEHKRAFGTDFEVYSSENKVELYISVLPGLQ